MKTTQNKQKRKDYGNFVISIKLLESFANLENLVRLSLYFTENSNV